MMMLSLLARPNHAIKELLCTAAQCLASTGFQFLDRFPGRGIWHPHIEWQSAAKHDLAQEHGDRIGGADAHFREHPRGPRFEFWLYPRRYECRLVHGSRRECPAPGSANTLTLDASYCDQCLYTVLRDWCGEWSKLRGRDGLV
jgi:hypothetical protein